MGGRPGRRNSNSPPDAKPVRCAKAVETFFNMEVSKEILKEIVDQLDGGFKVYFNIGSHEIVSFPDKDKGFDIDTVWKDEIDKVYRNIKKYIEIEQLSSRESYQMMEDFIYTIKDKNISTKLIQAIGGHKPFANFKHQIDQLESSRKKWFEFKEYKLMEYVKKQLKFESP